MSFMYLCCCLGSVEVDGAGMSGMLRINNLNARPLGVTDGLIQPAEINRVNNNENCHFTSLYREIKIEFKNKKRAATSPASFSFFLSFLPSFVGFLSFVSASSIRIESLRVSFMLAEEEEEEEEEAEEEEGKRSAFYRK